MMVQTGMAHRHGRGTQYNLSFHPALYGHTLLSLQMGSQQSHLPRITSTTKPSQAASPPAQVPSKTSVSLSLVQTAHETKEKAAIQEAKATLSSHVAIQSIVSYLEYLLGPPQGWLSRGALRLRLFGLVEPSPVLFLHRFLHQVIVESLQASSDSDCRL